MRKLIILLLLAACSPSGEDHSNSGEEIGYDVIDTSDQIVLRDIVSGDTIQTNTTYPVDMQSGYLPGARSYMNNSGGTLTYQSEKLSSNVYNLIPSPSKLVSIDSAVSLPARNLGHEETLPPKVIQAIPSTKKAIEPEQNRMGNWFYKDNAQYAIQVLDKGQGLASNNISCIIQDQQGFMWIGTDEGLMRYDGTYSKTYTIASGLPDDNIVSLIEGPDGSIWIGTNDGFLVNYDGLNFTSFSTDSIRPKRPIIHFYFDSKDGLWLTLMHGGLARYDGDNFEIYQEEQGVITDRSTLSISEDAEGRMWIIGQGRGVYVLENKVVKYMGRGSGVDINYANCNYHDKSGNQWIGMSGGAIFRIGPDSSTFYGIQNGDFDSYGAQQILEDSKGRIWLSFYGEGGLILMENDKLNRFSKTQGMPAQNVTKMCIDKFDRIWIGTEGGGLARFDHNSFHYLNKYNNYLDSRVYAFYERNGTEYYGTSAGLYEVRDSISKIYIGINGLEGGVRGLRGKTTGVVYDDDMEMIVSARVNAGITITKKMTASVMGGNMGGGPQNPICVTKGPDGVVWIGAAESRGLYQIKQDSLIRITPSHGLNMAVINCLLIDEDYSIWMGGKYRGLAKLNTRTSEVTYYTTDNGLPDNYIHSLYQDSKHRIWVSTPKGLGIYQDGNFSLSGIGDSLGIQNITAVISDDKERYWMTTEAGLLRLIPKNGTAPSDTWSLDNYQYAILDYEDGLNCLDFTPNSMFIDSKNQLRIGTREGMMVLPLDNVSVYEEAPKVYLENIRINGQRLSKFLEGSDHVPYHDYSENLILEYDQNNISFNYSGQYWLDPNEIKFSYKLNGFDEDWFVGNSNNQANYTNLPYGAYIFQLKAAVDTKESEVFTFSFEINRPWWHTWWARTLYVFSGLLLLVGIIRARTAQLKHRQKELEEEVNKATKEIRDQRDEIAHQRDEIEEAHREITDSIAYAKRIQSAILPPDKLVKEYIKQSFILYKPKDVVAGDFYWMEPLSEGVLFAAADCTGHGVPGAMVSVVCNNALNRAVREFALTDPGKILDKCRELVLEEFEKSDDEVKDGMDVALCLLKGKQIQYAGAHNPLWIVRNGELIEVKADKQPIGRFDELVPFTSHNVQLEDGDCIYIFSDGYVDQFGGERGKKFKSKAFKELLISITELPMDEQRSRIDEEFENWRGNLEQVDDICVIGVKI